MHALGVEGAAQLGLALDVDDVALADPGGGGDAHRMGEHEVVRG
jgi:hypothetical protein